mgnify:CR=1 FL=1
MQKIALLVTLLLPFSLLAQRGKKPKKPLIPTVFVSANFGLQQSNVIVYKDFFWDALYENSLFYHSGNGWQGDVRVGLNVWNHLEIQTGLGYDRRSFVQTSRFGYTYCDPVFYGATEVVGTYRTVTLESWEVPIEVRYRYQFKGFTLIPTVGSGLCFYTGKRQAVEVLMDNGRVATHEANDIELEHNRSTNFTLTARLGVGYQVTKRITAKLEPFYKKYLGKEELFTKYSNTGLRSFGMTCGVEYALKMGRLR